LDIKAYISSGIIESYVMGMASPAERKEFESLCKQYPELKAAREEFEKNLEERAFSNAMEPPLFLKDRVLDTIRRERSGRLISIGNPRMRWAVAVSIILLLGCSVFIFIMYSKNQELKETLATSRDSLQHLDEKARSLQNKNTNEQPAQVNLVDKDKNVITAINVFWDSTSTDVYLVIKDLKPLPAPKLYQLWSINEGKYTSLGMFNAPKDNKLILKMTNVQKANSFAITIEENSPNIRRIDNVE
jgi:anti-sigma-K factor RskA